MYVKQDWVPEGFEGVCMPVELDRHRSPRLMTVPIYRGHVTGSTEQGSVTELIADGTMSWRRSARSSCRAGPEWLGYWTDRNRCRRRSAEGRRRPFCPRPCSRAGDVR